MSLDELTVVTGRPWWRADIIAQITRLTIMNSSIGQNEMDKQVQSKERHCRKQAAGDEHDGLVTLLVRV